MNRVKSFLAFILIAFCAQSVFAAPQWYRGEVTRIYQYGAAGQFAITMDPPLNFCKYNYAYFSGEKFEDPERLQVALSIVLSAMHGGRTIGVVIDPEDLTSDGLCLVRSLDIR
ncbi:hypothetical protein MA04_02737 [Alcanivorax balearicus MACL04]|uniref:Uncharacterized protein n=1 Tax=Alloalcanivorax balearicus MACL04 TaxID=1177182 RepID=A0ABT2R0Y8_9GAMM|nr:hypothetical protein [Alloalcanivorax balearicus]MCU5783437.1 hypothetical protein [Alloalcanivorax balearicus MACL04]